LPRRHRQQPPGLVTLPADLPERRLHRPGHRRTPPPRTSARARPRPARPARPLRQRIRLRLADHQRAITAHDAHLAEPTTDHQDRLA
jgi:hypothetical protein